MEVLATTRPVPGGRPRLIPISNNSLNGEHVTVLRAGTGTMTRSSTQVSHHNYHQQCPPGSLANGSPPSASDTTIRDKTKLLQLAEKVHTRKTSNNAAPASTPNYTKSFRAITSAVVLASAGDRSNKESGTPKVRRTNSTMLSSSSSSCPPPPTRKLESYKNPKLYASFSSKSSSKLTKALIKSDPAKTNIEHLVNYKSPPKSEGKRSGSVVNSLSGKKSPPENGVNHHHHNGSSGGGLSSFITPLKALHASFHERSSKLGQTRSKLFSHNQQQNHNNHNRAISGSNAKLLFGTQENLHSSSSTNGSLGEESRSGSNSSSSSAEDILATEIGSQSKRNHNSKKSSSPYTGIITASSNNNTLSLSPSSSSRPIQNGNSASSTVCNVGILPVPPDFLEGFHNDNDKDCNNLNHVFNKRDGYHLNSRYQFLENSNQLNGWDETPNPAIYDNIPMSIANQNGRDEEIRKNQNPFSTPDILLTGCLNDSSNPREPYYHIDAPQKSSVNRDVVQKRKNIVMRMSYCDDNGETVDDLYRDENKRFDLCGVGDDKKGLQVEAKGGDEISNDDWSRAPIMVSTVTPKKKPEFVTAVKNADNFSDNNNGVHPTFSSFLASEKNHNNVPCDNLSRSLQTFKPKTPARAPVIPPPRTSSIISTVSVSNSAAVKPTLSSSQSSIVGQRNSQLEMNSTVGGEGEVQLHQTNCLKATGSILPKIKTAVVKEGGTLNGLDERRANDINNKIPLLPKHAIKDDNGGAGNKKAIQRRDSTLSVPIINGTVVGEKDELKGARTNEGGEQNRRRMFMEAETSLEENISLQPPQRQTRVNRPQTALFSDEYAQFLGHDYHKNENRLGDRVDASDNENGDVFCTEGDLKTIENLTMLAITTTIPSAKYRNGAKNLTSIMKPRNGEKHENGKKLVKHSVSFRGTMMNSDPIEKNRLQSNYKNLQTQNRQCNTNSGEPTRESVNGDNNDNDDIKTCSRLAKLGLSENITDFDRKKSRSLPKSFMSVKNGLRSVLPSQWVRDGLTFERLNDKLENLCPTDDEAEGSLSATSNAPVPQELKEVNKPVEEIKGICTEEHLKMRWHKLGSSSSSSSFSADRRPKSFDYAQRKAWMKLYRDMEVSQASGGSSNPLSLGSSGRLSRPLTKESISHLHLKESASSSQDCNLDKESEEDTEGSSSPQHSTMMRSSADISATSPSLFKRFSKTFSLRFGSGSNVSKQQQYQQNQHPLYPSGGDMQRNRKGKKGAIGSSPDLFNTRLEADSSRDKVNGKMRKTNVKSVRGDKCQSGDSGIGMDEQAGESHYRQISNLRRIRSDYISSTAAATSTTGIAPPSSSSSTYTSRASTNGSNLAKLSLVEIPDHSWDENGSSSSPNEESGTTSDTTSYEELVNAKLDDGFSSSDEGQSKPNQNSDQPPEYYHSLPHRRHNKRRLKEQGSNSCEDVPQEDNSIRGKVVREIIHTEQNYVKTLNDIVQGFLNPCRARNDLFSSRTVQNIFSNIEEILRLHVKFLEALKSKVDPTFVSKSNVGGVFTSWADKFALYSEYCCNNPISVATVRNLVQFQQYAEFFEACRRLQMMDKLPLHGFLLRPIQRICQYHLQLNELLKHTEESHADRKSVMEALNTMKSVATKINDTQRQFESLQDIIKFQNSIDGWEGPSLVDRNSVILRKGELVKVTHGRKQKEVFVAVLNKDLIYCKKDFMKKSGYGFDGRIDLNLRMWTNIDSNEEDEFFGMVHNSWRIYSPDRRAWILFTAPSPTEKRKWISALEKTKEDITVDPKLREMAVVTTALTESEMMSNGNSHSHHSNTLPKSSKKSKGKHLSVQKVDSDAMLIEVGKLKRSTMYTSSNSAQKEGTSKFYV